MEIVEVRLWRHQTRLKVPVVTRPGLELRERSSLLLSISTADGRTGWGEAAPLPGFSSDAMADVFRSACNLVSRLNTDRLTVPEEGGGLASVADELEGLPSLQFAVETALEAIPDQPPSETIEIPTAPLLQGDPSVILERSAAMASKGYRALKLKVGRGPVEDDVSLLRALRSHVGHEIELRADANRSWSVRQAAEFAEGISALDISYVEEPLADPEGLEQLAGDTGLRIALDESLFMDMLSESTDIPGYVEALVLKPTLLGWRTRALTEAARRAGVRVILSASYETGVGTAAVARAASRTAPAIQAAGLGTIAWLEQDCLRPSVDFLVPALDLRQVSGRMIKPAIDTLQPVVI